MTKSLCSWFVVFLVLAFSEESAAAVLYVDLNSTNPVAPFSSWGTAATNIQSAVDSIPEWSSGESTVWVSNGTYELTDEITISDNPGRTIVVQSVNGAAATIVDGGGTTGCFDLNGDCRISGFTIRNGYSLSGGGVKCAGGLQVVENCIITGNGGGGMYRGTANNCTIVGNSAGSGGGMSGGRANNCIIWYNEGTLENDLFSTAARYSCSPDVTPGVAGNITNAPLLVSSSHISAASPCRGAGVSLFSGGTDVDGEMWLNPPSMGCDEILERITGLIQLSLAGSTNICAGFTGRYSVDIRGAVTGNLVDFGDGETATNAVLQVSHAWNVPGVYTMVLTAFNDDHPAGISTTQAIHVFSAEDTAVYVSGATGSDANDGLSWEMAKKSVQAGVDVQSFYGGTVWVSNGIYAVTSEITVAKDVAIQSISGPDVTMIDGGGSNRCFNLMDSSCLLNGFTIRNGSTVQNDRGNWNGAGIYCSNAIPVVANCVISGNVAHRPGGGGGMYGGTAGNCIFTGNSASSGGGAYRSTLKNCIVWANSAQSNANWYEGTLTYCCTMPLPPGEGNFDANPLLADATHLSPGSPCIGWGNPAYVSGTDIDGDPWFNPPSVGADEFVAASATGSLAVAATADYATVATGFPLCFYGTVEGHALSNRWDFGDGAIAENQIIAIHAWSVPGAYAVVFTAWNRDFSNGVSTTHTVEVVEVPDLYVDVDSTAPQPPYGLWATAATNIQDAVAAALPGARIQVADGTYDLGSRTVSGNDTPNRLVIDKPVMVVATNADPSATRIDGNGDVRCVWLGTGATLSGFTLTNGASRGVYDSGAGGGAWCEDTTSTITNCLLVGNSAFFGGGACWGTLAGCVLTGNSASSGGGGAYLVTLTGCVLTGNSASSGGGMSLGVAESCTFTSNSARVGGGLYYSTANHCTITGNSAEGDGPPLLIGGDGSTIESAYLYTDFSLQRGGGGSHESTLNDCTLSSNNSPYGGGCDGGVLTHCTLSGNSASLGGGSWQGTLVYCTIIGNSAAGSGGGNCQGTLINCLLTGNMAFGIGGGSLDSTLHNCIISGNSAEDGGGGGSALDILNNCTVTGNSTGGKGGGAYKGKVSNCVVWYNMAGDGDNLYSNYTVANHTCSPDVAHGIGGNITNSPLLADIASGDYHLQSSSPCINWGSNVDARGSMDLAGNPRIVETYVDMGAYEYQGIVGLGGDQDGNGYLDSWEWEHFGGHVDPEGNADGDGSPNGDEYVAGTDPTNSASYFMVTTDAAEVGGETRFIIEWTAVTGRVYNVLWTPSLTQAFQPLEIGIAYPQNSYTDTVHSAESSGYYRVVVMRADYDADGDGLPNDWEEQYAVADAYADGDDDGFNNLAEFISGTDPTNGYSFFTAANSVAEVNGTNCFVVEWISIPDRLYSVQWSTNLVSGFHALETGITHPHSSYTDTTHNAESAGFYQVEVRMK